MGEAKSTAPGAQPHTLLCDPEWLGPLFEPQFSHLQSRVCDGKRNKGQAGVGAELPLCATNPRKKAFKHAVIV